MPDLNDFYAFKSTSSGNNSSGSNRGSSGGGNDGDEECKFLYVAAIISLIWIIAKLFS